MNTITKKTACLLLGAFIAVLAGCSKEKYPDVRKYVDEVIEYQNWYAGELEKAKDAGEVASLIDKYSDRMLEFAVKGKELNNKYPEMKDDDKLPEELKKQMDRLEKTAEELSVRMMNSLSKYMADPKVLQANIRMAEKFRKASETETDEEEK